MRVWREAGSGRCQPPGIVNVNDRDVALRGAREAGWECEVGVESVGEGCVEQAGWEVDDAAEDDVPSGSDEEAGVAGSAAAGSLVALAKAARRAQVL